MNDYKTDIACIRLGNIHVIIVSCPGIAREFLIKQDAVFASRPTNWSSEYVSLGYRTTALAPYGEHWRKMKRVITNELVSPLKHQWLYGKREEEADNLVRYVYNKCKNGGLVDVREAAQHYDGNIIRKLFFSRRNFGKGREDGGPGFEEVEHEVMIATVDNPSNAVEWGLAEMLNQPELLKKATEELDSVVSKGRLVQESDFPKLNYVKACAREAFRLHPIVDFNVAHSSMSDTIVANLVLIEPSLNLITFGTGRRSCPGIMLGTSMVVMLFARLLNGFTCSVPPNEPCIDLSESEGGTIKAKPLLAFAKPRLLPEVYDIR
ncbi:unnamed protein product [Lupinus luteus]|uniref:Cytochrome P450 n=1 Tax=Lupinus luteus TaxID=3873 RepID=A0AAV1YLR1_LUPLU